MDSGIYEIQSTKTGLFLTSLKSNALDAISLEAQPGHKGKWEIAQVGGGYVIKQVKSGLYCEIAGDGQAASHPIVLGAIPTVWKIDCVDEASSNFHVRIVWSTMGVFWDPTLSMKVAPQVSAGGGSTPECKLALKTLDNSEETLTKDTAEWYFKRVAGSNGPTKLLPGMYSIQNKKSGTFLMLGPDEKRLGCWPKDSFKDGNTKLWEVTPFGDGYLIRLYPSDLYCTLQEGIGSQSRINVSSIPAAWRIVPNRSSVHHDDQYYQIFWADTKLTWDLHEGKKEPGTHISLQEQKDYQECHLFRFVP